MNRVVRLRFVPVVLVVSMLLAGCSDDPGGESTATTSPERTTTTQASTTTSAAPESVTGAEWEVGTPEEHGMDPAVLEGARTYAFAEGKNTQGVVVIRNGTIVAEWYAPGADQDSWAASWSMAKSVASALVGIAIGEGKIPSIDEPMTTYFPDWAERGLGDITLLDVLEMSPGLQWEENYRPETAATSDIIKMVTSETDQLAFAASRPRAVPPGTIFNYSSGASMLLSAVIEQATGMTAGEYAQEKLWDPIGATKVDMWTDAVGHTLTYCCVDTTSRDFARLGQLYLDGGRWGGQQVVPEEWVTRSVEPSRAEPDRYGLQWWLGDVPEVPADMFNAAGHDGQWIWVIPSLDLVVVRNGTYVKFDGPPVADPNLFARYPSDGLVPGKGTLSPDIWFDADFLGPIVDSIQN